MPLFTPVAIDGYLDASFTPVCTGGYLGATVYSCSYRWILGCHCLHLYLQVDTWLPLFTPVPTDGYFGVTVYTCTYSCIIWCHSLNV